MKTVLFDFDYTLVDSSDAIVTCFQQAVIAAGHPAPEGIAIKRAIGQNLDDMYMALLGTMKGWPQFRKAYFEKADKIMNEETKPFEDTIQTLVAIKARGCQVGIVSPKFRYRINDWLQRHQLIELIDLVIGGDDVSENMPSPEGIIRAIVCLNSPKETTCFVGDSIFNYQAAESAKIRFIPVLNGSTTIEDFKRAGYKQEIYANGLSALLDYL